MHISSTGSSKTPGSDFWGQQFQSLPISLLWLQSQVPASDSILTFACPYVCKPNPYSLLLKFQGVGIKHSKWFFGGSILIVLAPQSPWEIRLQSRRDWTLTLLRTSESSRYVDSQIWSLERKGKFQEGYRLGCLGVILNSTSNKDLSFHSSSYLLSLPINLFYILYLFLSLSFDGKC